MSLAAHLQRDIQTGHVKTRGQVAYRYSFVIRAHMGLIGEDAAVPQLNAQIVKRWSPSGLDWIKKLAWQIATDS